MTGGGAFVSHTARYVGMEGTLVTDLCSKVAGCEQTLLNAFAFDFLPLP